MTPLSVPVALSATGTARQAARALADPDAGVRETAAHALARLGAAAAAAVVPLLASPDIGVRNRAGEVLIRLGADAVPALAPQVGHADADVRKFAIDVLAQLPAEALAEDLAARLHDADANVRLAAVDALGALGVAGPYAEALHALYAQEPLARPSVLVALGASGHAASAGLVVAALADEDAVVRLAATEALAALDVPDGLPLFLRAHADAEAEARPVVLAALVRWLDAHPDAAADLPAGLEDALAAMLDDPDPALREAAARGFRYVAHRLEPARLLAPAGRDDALDVALFDALVARPDPFGTLVDAGGAVAPAAAASFAAALLAQGHVAEPDVDRVGRFLHGRFGALDGDTKLAVLELCARRRHPALARVLDAGLADPDAVVHAAAADLMPARTPADPGASA